MTEQPKNIQEALRWASLFLQSHEKEPKVAEMLIQHHAGLSKAMLLASLRDKLSEQTWHAFRKDVEAHAATSVPVQHLTGKEEFYGREFFVNGDVLIPRPETEELVAGLLDYLAKQKPAAEIVDVGTGSGIIAVSLKKELPGLHVQATDISKGALAVARQNAARLEADVTFYEGNFLQPLLDQGIQADVIVSNPPYIAYQEEAALDDTVKNYDPALALFAAENGLAAYREILTQAVSVLKKDGLLAFEIGYEQGKAVRQLIQAFFPDSKIEVRKDINGKDRMVFAAISR